MKNPSIRLPLLCICLAAPAELHASELVYEPFDYVNFSPESLINLNEGTGWASAWRGDSTSQPAFTYSPGFSYTDAIGNQLHVSGWAATTADGQGRTTRVFRTIANGPLNNVWISFLWVLPNDSGTFRGFNLYRGDSEVMRVSNPSNTSSSQIYFGNAGTSSGASTGKGEFQKTHLVVLRLAKGAGANDTDLAEIFVDPALSAVPSQPDHSITGPNFDFDGIRLAAQNGTSLYFDEFRVGSTFASVTPHNPAPVGLDSDNDGLTDAQEAVLGTDPHVSNAGLFAAIRSRPQLFGLHDSTSILQQGQGGVILPKEGSSPVGFSFQIQQSENLTNWPELETFQRSVEIPAGKNFLRVTLEP